MSTSALDQLKQWTTVVADSSDLDAIAKFRPLDATTNPSLITAAAKQVDNRALIESAFAEVTATGLSTEARIEAAIDILTVKLGVEILKLIDGRVSTEVDASLSFDTAATVSKAKELLALYAGYGISSDRILIKIASTWEGIQAAEILEREGIHCNLTLLFNMAQAQACADAKVTLISPFVGRILDWYKKAEAVEQYPIAQDPGVLSVKAIYQHYKQHGIQTQVMGASFRSIDQVLALAGCDLLTIAPQLLEGLSQDTRQVERALVAATDSNLDADCIDEDTFRQRLAQDPMASELLEGGINGFIQAREQLHALLASTFADALSTS